jgi:hypothetical protein
MSPPFQKKIPNACTDRSGRMDGAAYLTLATGQTLYLFVATVYEDMCYPL